MIQVQQPVQMLSPTAALGRKMLADDTDLVLNVTLMTGSAAETASVLQRLQTIVRLNNGGLAAALSTAGIELHVDLGR